MASSHRFLRHFIHDLKICRVHHRSYTQYASYLRPQHNSTLRTAPCLPRLPRRTFSSSNVVQASLASHPPGEPTELVYYPTPDTLPPPEDPDDPEVELIPPEEAKIEMTERAAEVRVPQSIILVIIPIKQLLF